MTTGGQYLRNEQGFRVQLSGGVQIPNYVWRAGRACQMNGRLSQAIIPVAKPWPYASDRNGIAYPAGLVGVQYTYSPFQPDPVAFNNALLVAVPAALPVGYTFRADRTHLSTPLSHAWTDNCQAFAISGGGLIFTPGTVASDYYNATTGAKQWLLRDTTGMSGWGWFPENIGQDAWGDGAGGGASTLFGSGGVVDKINWFNARCAGLRYLRVSGVSGATGTLLELVCNSDGTKTWPADTVLWSYTTPTAGTAFDTGLLGQINAPGTREKVWMGFRASVGGGFGAPTYLAMMGPRLDIPFPWSCYGVDGSGGHIVAPGGT